MLLSRLALLTGLMAATVAASVPAVPPPRPQLAVHATGTPPQIDGVLDDPAWRDAAHSDAFRQVSPVENAAPTERTEVWVTFDADNLYVAIRCHDSAGLAGIRAYSMQRDQDNGSDDLVRVVFDSFNRQNDGYYFGLTAAGGMHDGLIQNKEETNDRWDAIWLGKVTRDAGGWSAEFAIPVKSIAFDPANNTWGFNVSRTVRRKQEVMRWSGFVRAKGVTALSELGELHGLTGLRQGRGLDVKPYASLTHRTAPAAGEAGTEFNPGLDLVWHATPTLAATLTVNTDFADAEVDDRQVNLGRFSLFFPEKRGFFTQDAPLFSFAGIGQDPLPFFSRRIGLADDGSRVDLLGGAKLTGRAGPWTIGLLDVETDAHEDIAEQNLFVGRVARQVLAESSAGLIVTHGDPRGGGGNSLVGVDFNYVNSQLPGHKTLTVRTGVQTTDSDRAGGRGTASTLSVNYPNEPYGFTGWFSRVDREYDPALGFVSRTGVQDFYQLHTYNWYPKKKLVQFVQFFAESDHVTDLHTQLLDTRRWVGVYAEDPQGDWTNWWVGHARDQYDEPFAIWPGVVIPVGQHPWDHFQGQFGTTPSRPFNASVRWRHGGFITGRTDEYGLNLGARPSDRIELGIGAGLSDIRLPQGNFRVRTGTARAVYTFSPDLQVRLLAQYDNMSNSLGVNFRVKWIVQPGNEIFFVVDQGYDTAGERLRPTHTDTSLKAAWTFRY
jgi:hypothetical protein